MRILLLDIETAPNLAHCWGLWNVNVGLPQLIASGFVMCWSAKWYGEKEIFFDSFVRSKPRAMLNRIHKLLDEAHAVVHYNGRRFDVPTLNKEFLQHGITPPSPYKQIDLLSVARRQFRFPSNKLDYVSQVLGVGKKVKHKGHQLWIDCMAKDELAWRMMERYNKQDVRLLEQVYVKMLPWVMHHPNHGVYDQVGVCPNCGGADYIRKGYAHTNAYIYQKYHCRSCGSWFRGHKTITERSQEKFRAAA